MAVIKDVAELAGVSVGTVSKYLNSPNSLTDKKKLAVECAIKELNYVPNLMARNLRTQDSRTIAIIAQEIDNPFHAKLYSILRCKLIKFNYTVILYSVNDVDGDLTSLFDTLPIRYFSGIILCYFHDMEKQIEFARKYKHTPMVIMSNEYKYINKLHKEKFVYADFMSGLKTICNHLINCGNSSIAYIGCKTIQAKTDKDPKLQGFLSALKSHNLAPHSIIQLAKGFNMNTGYEATQLLLKKDMLPDAILVDSDVLAIGVIRCLIDHGIYVPYQIMIASCDDIDIAEYYYPKLTTLHVPIEDLCAVAVDLLMKQLDKECDVAPTNAYITNLELKVRETTYQK